MQIAILFTSCCRRVVVDDDDDDDVGVVAASTVSAGYIMRAIVMLVQVIMREV
jgi:hypothetical protein